MNLISIDDLSIADVNHLLASAHAFKQDKFASQFTQQSVAFLFFEPSTRTRLSFELAAKNLNLHTLQFDGEHSSLKKGEAKLDTLQTISAMGVNALVIRQSTTLALDNIDVPNDVCIINAGDGVNEHPSQALLDAMTIQQYKPDWKNLKIAIVGDSRHSRVANSNIKLLTQLGVKNIRVVGPENFLPEQVKDNTQHYTDLEQGIQAVDVVMLLRIQKERLTSDTALDLQSYHQHYGFQTKHLERIHPQAIIMHPGPMNRGVEIDDAVADGPQSVILQQVKNGVLMRMAILNWLLSHKS